MGVESMMALSIALALFTMVLIHISPLGNIELFISKNLLVFNMMHWLVLIVWLFYPLIIIEAVMFWLVVDHCFVTSLLIFMPVPIVIVVCVVDCIMFMEVNGRLDLMLTIILVVKLMVVL